MSLATNDEVRVPAAPASPIPHRKIIRDWLKPVSGRNTAYALALTVLDLLFFAAGMAGVVFLPGLPAKLAAGLVTGFVIARLFILGHDACHQSFTPRRRLNRWLGRVVFLPSLTPYSLWEAGHNIVHHGYTNLRGFDFVWQPQTLEGYRALPRWRRLLERVYRSGWAPWLYYMVEIWWARMMFPNREHMPTRRHIFTLDCLLVSAAALVWVGALSICAHLTGQSAWPLIVAGFVLPTVVWNGMIGFVVYVHHTHERISWYEDKNSWAQAQPFVSTTVHLTFRRHAGALLHHIMEHTAHHVDMSIPLYRLREAQKILEARLPGLIVIQPFSWRWYFETARKCKLYDFNARCWTDFRGQPTSPAAA
jgi:omega-6 fatty acid desaturase (delta-12 desaturase)